MRLVFRIHLCHVPVIVSLNTAAVTRPLLHRKPASARNLESILPLQFNLLPPSKQVSQLLKVFLNACWGSYLEVFATSVEVLSVSSCKDVDYLRSFIFQCPSQ
jgi:hypothetical protein